MHNTKAIIRDVDMVARIIGSDWAPVLSTTERSRPKPRRITAYCNIFLDVKVIHPANGVLSLISSVIIIPATIAKTGPPIIGSNFPR